MIRKLKSVILRGEAKALGLQLYAKTVTVTGHVIDYKGKPEIIVTEKAQLRKN